MAENHVSTGPPIARKPRRYQVDEGLDARFLRQANSARVSQTLWRGLLGLRLLGSGKIILTISLQGPNGV